MWLGIELAASASARNLLFFSYVESEVMEASELAVITDLWLKSIHSFHHKTKCFVAPPPQSSGAQSIERTPLSHQLQDLM